MKHKPRNVRFLTESHSRRVSGYVHLYWSLTGMSLQDWKKECGLTDSIAKLARLFKGEQKTWPVNTAVSILRYIAKQTDESFESIWKEIKESPEPDMQTVCIDYMEFYPATNSASTSLAASIRAAESKANESLTFCVLPPPWLLAPTMMRKMHRGLYGSLPNADAVCEAMNAFGNAMREHVLDSQKGPRRREVQMCLRSYVHMTVCAPPFQECTSTDITDTTAFISEELIGAAGMKFRLVDEIDPNDWSKLHPDLPDISLLGYETLIDRELLLTTYPLLSQRVLVRNNRRPRCDRFIGARINRFCKLRALHGLEFNADSVEHITRAVMQLSEDLYPGGWQNYDADPIDE
jgi:hypothetical protein